MRIYSNWFSGVLRLLLPIALLGGLTACETLEKQTYKIDVKQGNIITQDMVAQLRPGLSRDQVRFILGTPLVTDLFHENRWDYVYHFQHGKTGKIEQRKLTVFFENDLLSRVGGDVAANAASGAAAEVPQQKVIEIQADEKKGLMDRMLPKKDPAKVEEEKKKAAEKAAAEKAAAEKKAAEKAAEKAAAEKAAAEKKAAEERVAAEKAAARKAADEKAEAEKKAETEKKPEADKKAEGDKKEEPKKGFFGRMKDKLGF